MAPVKGEPAKLVQGRMSSGGGGGGAGGGGGRRAALDFGGETEPTFPRPTTSRSRAPTRTAGHRGDRWRALGTGSVAAAGVVLRDSRARSARGAPDGRRRCSPDLERASLVGARPRPPIGESVRRARARGFIGGVLARAISSWPHLRVVSLVGARRRRRSDRRRRWWERGRRHRRASRRSPIAPIPRAVAGGCAGSSTPRLRGRPLRAPISRGDASWIVPISLWRAPRWRDSRLDRGCGLHRKQMRRRAPPGKYRMCGSSRRSWCTGLVCIAHDGACHVLSTPPCRMSHVEHLGAAAATTAAATAVAAVRREVAWSPSRRRSILAQAADAEEAYRARRIVGHRAGKPPLST